LNYYSEWVEVCVRETYRGFGMDSAAPPGISSLLKAIYGPVHFRPMHEGSVSLQHGWAREGSRDWFIFVREGLSASEIESQFAEIVAARIMGTFERETNHRREMADAFIFPEDAARRFPTESPLVLALRFRTTPELVLRRRVRIAKLPARLRAKVINIDDVRTTRTIFRKLRRSG
jgi:hypothetical protein